MTSILGGPLSGQKAAHSSIEQPWLLSLIGAGVVPIGVWGVIFGFGVVFSISATKTSK